MTRAHITSLLERDIREVIFEEYDLHEDQFSEFYPSVNSGKSSETDVVMAGFDRFRRKTEGEAPEFDNAQEAYRKVYTAATFALGFEITEEGMEDDLTPFYQSLGRELSKAARYTREVEAMDLFNNLSDTVYSAGGSNYTLLSSSHYREDGGTWSNTPSLASDLSLESFEAALSAWRTGMVDHRGRKITVQPEILLVGPSDEFIAERIIASPMRPFGSDNDVNAAKRRRNIRVVVSDYLTDDGRWFLLAGKGKTGLRYQNRVPFQTRRRDDPYTGNMMMVGRYRESHGATHPTGIYGSS